MQCQFDRQKERENKNESTTDEPNFVSGIACYQPNIWIKQLFSINRNKKIILDTVRIKILQKF